MTWSDLHLSDVGLLVGVAIAVVTFLGSLVSLTETLSRQRRMRTRIVEYQEIWQRLPTESPLREPLLARIEDDVDQLLEVEWVQSGLYGRMKRLIVAYVVLSLPSTIVLIWRLSNGPSGDVTDSWLLPILGVALFVSMVIYARIVQLGLSARRQLKELRASADADDESSGGESSAQDPSNHQPCPPTSSAR